MNTMKRIEVDAATQVADGDADGDADDITIPEIGDALSEIAAKLDQFGHPSIADEVRALGVYLADPAPWERKWEAQK
jgi:hypothetical protein